MIRQLRILAGIVLLLLAACSPSNQAQTLNTTLPPTSTPAGSSTGTPSGTSYSVQVTGSVTSTIASGTDRVDFFKQANGQAAYQLAFTKGDGDFSVQITFYGANAPASGNYQFTLDVVDGSVTAQAFQTGQSSNLSFTLGQGQLTLTKADDGYSGTFQFTSKGGQAGLQDQSVTVNGTFAKVQITG